MRAELHLQRWTLIDLDSRLLNTGERIRTQLRRDHSVVHIHIVVVPHGRVRAVAFHIDERLLAQRVAHALRVLVVHAVLLEQRL